MQRAFKIVTGVVGLAFVASCTVKDVEIPALSGPSTLSYSILLTASTDTLTQDGVSSATIDITARDGNGQVLTGRPLRAAILVGGVVQDFGSLNTKTPVTGGTLRYTAPPASPLPSGQVAQTVTVAVTPTDSGDFLNDFARGVDIRLVPQGVILPTNPDLAPAFTVTPASPQAFATASFDASTTTNGTTACLNACGYAWNFGDGTSGTGMTTTHDYRTVGLYQVVLTVTDSRGAQAVTIRTVTVTASTPPTATFVISPTPVSIDQDVFFDASQSRATLPRRIVGYAWNFGDGNTSSGVTVSRRFSALGTYNVILTVTDDVGAVGQSSQTLAVTEGLPSVTATAQGLKVNGITQLNITATPATGSTIVSYRVVWGDETAAESGTSPTHTHKYTAVGTYTIVVTVTDSLGRTKTITVAAAVTA